MSNDLEIRSSQALYNYATGSIADFPDLSLMILSPDITNIAWGDEKHDLPPKKIKDDRLAKIFSIEEFVQPPEPNSKIGIGIQAIRFPKTLFCPVCKHLHYVNTLRKRKDLYFDRKKGHFDQLNKGYYCPNCHEENSKKITLSPTRFVIANEYGFIEDFPWDWYCHRNEDFRKNRRFSSSDSCYDVNPGSHLKLIQYGGSASLNDIVISCKCCDASENLGSIFDQEDTFMRPYDNYLLYRNFQMSQPWLGRSKSKSVTEDNIFNEDELKSITDDNKERFKKIFPRTLQRGGGNVHFPITHKGISLPRDSYNIDSDRLFQKLDQNLEVIFSSLPTFSDLNFEESIRTILNQGFQDFVKDELIDQIGSKNVEVYLKNKLSHSENNLVNTEKVRWEEYNCFLYFNDEKAEPKEWYKSQIINGNEYSRLPYVDKVVILNKLRLLNILKGFTRVRPLALNELKFANSSKDIGNERDNLLREFQRINDVRKEPEITNWLPATEIKGEGIFISLDHSSIKKWLNNISEASSRASQLRKNYISNLKKFDPYSLEEDHDYINANYILLHTLSHLLIEEIAQTSGYNSASLSEIIYSSRNNSEYDMSGLLIYTSSSDAEGTLGGLAEHGRPGKLESLFRKALQKAEWCSSDPLCIETKTGQGFMGVNLSACHSCCMLPESSCENLNKFLDRGLLLGTLDNKKLGFFNYIKSENSNE